MSPLASCIGAAVLIVFACAYALVFAEEKIGLRKSKPVMAAAGLMWILVAIAFQLEGRPQATAEKLREALLDFAELFLFLLAAMSFVNAMVERHVFEHLRTRLLASKTSVRALFWQTGLFAFFLSPVADNLTTALVAGTVVLTSLKDNKHDAAAALVSVVVAANAGGTFSPFGDITTLMIWQKGAVDFAQFFTLFIPALANWLVPAAIISLSLSPKKLEPFEQATAMRQGGGAIAVLFLLTVCGTVFSHHYLHLPPFLGMMTGLGALNIYGYFLKKAEMRVVKPGTCGFVCDDDRWPLRKPFDIFGILEKVEWDTLLFFYGIMLCIAAVGAMGFLESLSQFFYADLGVTASNILIGLLSSVVDNIPLTFAVLTMNPQMELGQWLLLTLTAGVGGSLLSVGSAAGVALMGIGRGTYSFASHFKWTWAIALGFVASVGLHIALNWHLFAGQI